MDRRITRRFLLKGAAAAATVPLPLVEASCASNDTRVPRPGVFFEDDERRAVAALSNVVIPAEPGSLGASDLGAAAYIERLLTAFDYEPPRIYCDGPFSGRQPYADQTGQPTKARPENAFLRFIPLDRVAERAWRIRLFGTKAVLGADFNAGVVDDVIGLRDLFKDGIRAAIAASADPIESLSPDALKSVFFSLEPALQNAFVDLVGEGTMGAPEYAGNVDMKGWALVRYEGDSLPLGYTQFDATTGRYLERPDAPMSGPGPAVDPAPMDDGTRDLLKLVVGVTGGKVFG